MSLVTVDLPSDPDELRAFAQALQQQLATVEQARVSTAVALASTADELASTAALGAPLA